MSTNNTCSEAEESRTKALEAQIARIEAEYASRFAQQSALLAQQKANAELAEQKAELARQQIAELARQNAELEQKAELAELKARASSSSSASSESRALSSPPAQSASNLKESIEAFSNPFINDSNVSERLLSHLKQATEAGNINYVALVQGSGHGKTRGIIETCRLNGVLAVYMCFREAGSTGFPVRGVHVDEVLTLMHAQGVDPVRKLLCCILAAVEKRLLEFDNSKGAFSFRPFGLDESFGIDNSFWKDVLRYQESAEHRAFSTERLEAILRRIDSKFVGEAEKLKLVFIWDEARALIHRRGFMDVESEVASEAVSAFRLLRRVIMEREFEHTVSVFLDTSSAVSNFLPVSANDKSSRFFTRKPLPPFIHFGQSNAALMRRVDSFSKEAMPKKFTRESLLELRGRALWISYRSVGTAVSSLILTAREKFSAQSLGYGGKDAKLIAASMAAACAIAASVAQMDIVPISALASDMVHSHLGTLIAVSDDRKATLASFPSEPIVARAALCFLNVKAWACAPVLQEVARALSHGLALTTAGAAGEFVSRIYVLLHRAISCDGHMNDVVPKETLRHFLQSLIGLTRSFRCFVFS